METVVIVHHTGEWGGGTRSLIDLCEMLKEEYNVIVCIPKGYSRFAEKISEYGCTTFELSDPIPFINVYSGRPPLLSVVTMRSLKSLKYIKNVGEEILSLNPSVVIFNTLITAITARYLSKKTRVICVDRETLNSAFAKLLYRLLLDKHLDIITCLSEYERKKINFKKTESMVFPDCVNLKSLKDISKREIRNREGIKEDKYAILYMGGLSKIKGADIIMEAINSLDNRFLLIFAGGIDEKKLSSNQLIHDIKYPAIYCFKKRVIRQYYRLKGTEKLLDVGLRDSVDDLIIASDVVVFPSTSVHQPRPCIEAGAYRKPVIISDYPETEEYFKDGYNALTFIPGDAKDLAEKIRYAYEHDNIMMEMGNNNRFMTESYHDFNACKKTICHIIKKLC